MVKAVKSCSALGTAKSPRIDKLVWGVRILGEFWVNLLKNPLKLATMVTLKLVALID